MIYYLKLRSTEKENVNLLFLEGILNSHRYGEMLKELIRYFDENAFAYYFDLSLEETIRRHNTRDKRHEFGEDSLQNGIIRTILLRFATETIFTDNFTQKIYLMQFLMMLRSKNKPNIIC